MSNWHIGCNPQFGCTVRVKRHSPSAPRTIGTSKDLQVYVADWPCFLSVQITLERLQQTLSSKSALQ